MVSHRLLIPLAALVAIHPLLVHGCSCGHDFDFHLLNWMEAARQFTHGNLHPHWAYTPAYNAGEPRFVFYPPISWYLGAILSLILTHLPFVSEAAAWTATPILFTWIALTLSGLTLHRLARVYLSPNAALLAATLYLANPYMLFTAFERTAYAELLAAAWMPLLFHAILSEKISIPRIALPVALLWLTNAPAAVMGCYTLAFLALVRLATNPGAPGSTKSTLGLHYRPALSLTLKTIAGTTLGLALAAFYILPAAYERRYVQIAMATIVGMRIDHNFLFEHTGTTADAILHDQVLHTASLIAVILLLTTALALAFTRRATKPGAPVPQEPGAPHLASEMGECSHKFPTLPLTLLTAFIFFLLTPLSLPLWNHAPQATFLQFSWRLLAILAPIFALTLARAATNSPGAPSIAALSRWVGRKKLTGLALLLLTAALTAPAYHAFRQPCDPEDTAPARLALFHSNAGTDPTDEYTPAGADNDALAPTNPPYWLASTAADAPHPGVPGELARGSERLASEIWAGAPSQPGPAPTHLTLTAPTPEILILNLRNYPAWRITLNGAPAPQRHRPDGLIATPIPAGPSTVDIRYAQTPDQTLGDLITLLALPLFLLALRRSPKLTI